MYQPCKSTHVLYHIPYTMKCVSTICQHKDVPLTMSHNIHVPSTKNMCQECINITSTICNHVPCTTRVPRHALIMCHTIHETSLKQTHVKHTFTHEENLVHIISNQQIFLNFRINNMAPSSSIFKSIC